MIRRWLTLSLVLLIALSSSGCLLGLAAAIRWDQRRFRKMQEDKRVEEEKGSKAEGFDTGPARQRERRVPSDVPTISRDG